MKALRIFLTVIVLFCIANVNGQTNWTLISQPGINLTITNETTAYSYINETVGSHGMKYSLKKSTDGFLSFTNIKTKTGDLGCYSLDEMFYINSDTGFIAELCQGLTSIYKTTNGGENWAQTGYGGAYGLSMFFLNENFGYYSFYPGGSNNSYLIQSGTQVYTTTKYIFTKENFQYPNYTTKIKFINDSIGFIICKDTLDNAVILKTSNSGYNWNEVKLLNNNLFKDIFFITDDVGFVIGTNGYILKTNNMGDDWQTINSNTSFTLNSIDFSNDNIGCIVGDNGLILKSQDLGLTWSQESFINTNDLIYMRAFENDHLYINDANGNLYSNSYYLGVTENWKNDVLIYPNPTDEKLNILIPANIKYFYIVLYDLSGQRILLSSDDKLDLNGLTNGMYILEIETEQGIYRKKIIKE